MVKASCLCESLNGALTERSRFYLSDRSLDLIDEHMADRRDHVRLPSEPRNLNLSEASAFFAFFRSEGPD